MSNQQNDKFYDHIIDNLTQEELDNLNAGIKVTILKENEI